jgi:hypothetical protein
VASGLADIRSMLSRLPRSTRTLPAVEALDAIMAGLRADAADGAALDAAMDEIQGGLAHVNDVVFDVFMRAAE